MSWQAQDVSGWVWQGDPRVRSPFVLSAVSDNIKMSRPLTCLQELVISSFIQGTPLPAVKKEKSFLLYTGRFSGQ